ncbi:MAG: hypothetical protein ACRD2Z_07770 [Thermoanaerobaculia bacterium]
MRFWDTSALVALFIRQPRTTVAREAFGDDPEAVLWWATRVAYESALHRLRREGILDEAESAIARESLSALREAAVEVQPSDELRARAIRLLAEHRLREAADGAGFTVLPKSL